MNKIYMCIDLKSFYASVECVLRNLDPLNTNLVVADETHTDKTICLAVSSSLKKYGIGGRARLFEVKQKITEINNLRHRNNQYQPFTGESFIDSELKAHPHLKLTTIIAPPRIALYMKYSSTIYNIYLKYIAPEDILVYSIDEVFIDITNYLSFYKLTPRELATKIIKDVYNTTSITATAGLGTNMFLAKVAMDIVAKKITPNEFGVRIACLTEKTYRQQIWPHRPITDIWRIGHGTATKLAANNMYTMGDIARCSHYNEQLLYKLFGVNAELLIDHAWGYEPCPLNLAKNYKSQNISISRGQVLHRPYKNEEAQLIIKEMADNISLDLVAKHLITDQIVLIIEYDIENLTNPTIACQYTGEITTDQYGRKVPKKAHGTININHKTSSSKIIMRKSSALFKHITNPLLLIRKIYIILNKLEDESYVPPQKEIKQLDIFSNNEEFYSKKELATKEEQKERELNRVILNIKNKYGKNSLLKGINLEKCATTIERNTQIGGHHE